MAGQQPTQRTYVKDHEGKLLKLTDEWKQAKGHLTGKITVTPELAELFQDGATIQVVTFPNGPKPADEAAKPAAKSRKTAAHQPAA